MCLFFEGNDFRAAKRLTKAPSQWSRFFKRSPIVQAIDEFLIEKLGPIGAHREVPGMEMLSWLPLAVEGAAGTTYYAFEPSVVVKHYVSRSEFESGRHWSDARYNLEQIHQLCRQAGAELVIIYAPTKPHVVLPLVADELPADKVRAFTALRAKRELPEPQLFLRNLINYLGVKEGVLEDWCRQNDIAFVSLTEPLRQSIRRGEQPYYTYNEHWSPVGQTVAAEAACRFWVDRQARAGGGAADEVRARPGSNLGPASSHR
jgi:hypothetical protein